MKKFRTLFVAVLASATLFNSCTNQPASEAQEFVEGSKKAQPEKEVAQKDVSVIKTGTIERIQRTDGITYVSLKNEKQVYQFVATSESEKEVSKSLSLAQAGDSISFSYKDNNPKGIYNPYKRGSCGCSDSGDEILGWNIIAPTEKSSQTWFPSGHPGPSSLPGTSVSLSEPEPKIVYKYRYKTKIKRDTVFVPVPMQIDTATL